MYRVRYSWDNPNSQLGAYDVYKNAVQKADKYYGFKIFDDSGKELYVSSNNTKVNYRVRKKWSDEDSQVGAYDIYDNAVKKANEVGEISVFDHTGKNLYTAPIAVKTMSYKAKLLKNVGKHKKGESITVTRDFKKQWVMTDGTIVPQKSYMDLTKQLYDPNCKYSKEVAENFVNTRGYKSATEWLFWCNKWGQRVYVFQGSKGHWVLKKTMKCGTGNIKDGDGSDQGVGFSWKIYDKKKQFQGPRAIQYWNMHYSSLYGNSIHKGTVGKPSTHGCIALSETSAKWAFETLPLNTKVIVY